MSLLSKLDTWYSKTIWGIGHPLIHFVATCSKFTESHLGLFDGLADCLLEPAEVHERRLEVVLLEDVQLHGAVRDLGSGRNAASAIEAPNMLAVPVWSG